HETLRWALLDLNQSPLPCQGVTCNRLTTGIVAPDSRVELSGVALFGDKRSQLTEAASPSGPLVQVKAVAIVGDVNVR
ncbi:MAG: hypothetical protein ABR609_02220, partial [Acidimicrobiia bacterium]